MFNSFSVVIDKMPYVLIRNGKVIQHYVMLGDLKKNWKRDQKLVDLKFDTKEAANEIGVTIRATVKEVA